MGAHERAVGEGAWSHEEGARWVGLVAHYVELEARRGALGELSVDAAENQTEIETGDDERRQIAAAEAVRIRKAGSAEVMVPVLLPHPEAAAVLLEKMAGADV